MAFCTCFGISLCVLCFAKLRLKMFIIFKMFSIDAIYRDIMGNSYIAPALAVTFFKSKKVVLEGASTFACGFRNRWWGKNLGAILLYRYLIHNIHNYRTLYKEM